MRASLFFRCMLAFCLESQLVAGALLLLGCLPASFFDVAVFSLAATLLLSLGGWLYHGGGNSIVLHLLLYPLVAAIGALCTWVFDSWAIGLLLAGLFFWRVHTVVTIRLYHHDLLRRFILAMFGYIFNLVYVVMFVSLYQSDVPDYQEFFAMLTLLVGSYIVVGWGEFLTREKPPGVSLPPTLLARLGGQLLAAKALLTAAYATAAGLVLTLLVFLWSLIKQPFGDLLYTLFLPLLELIAYLAARLSGVLGKDDRFHNLNNGEGSGEQLAEELGGSGGETLFSMLQPYLAAALAIAFVFWLARKIWLRRFVADKKEETVSATLSTATVFALSPAEPVSAGIGSRLRSLFDEWFGPKDDRVRYLYYQFLRYMAAQGIKIEKHETSHEFLNRVSQVWSDQARIQLAVRITDCYERYRYYQKPLAEEEVAALESCLKQLRGK
ncbi:DUF4129 domain-containing protein [Brevibacillus sp. H7]|uniref:DUF4129 domain-containing protein n=1 Tax=Brevibacillus sp. H7 TaxID=3349138 RepID=UPI003823AE23